MTFQGIFPIVMILFVLPTLLTEMPVRDLEMKWRLLPNSCCSSVHLLLLSLHWSISFLFSLEPKPDLTNGRQRQREEVKIRSHYFCTTAVMIGCCDLCFTKIKPWSIRIIFENAFFFLSGEVRTILMFFLFWSMFILYCTSVQTFISQITTIWLWDFETFIFQPYLYINSDITTATSSTV